MSLLAFQLAMADLTASLAFCRRVAEDAETALAGRELTPRELRRVAAAAGQPGVMVNCTLYRYNRITALAVVMPGVLHLLGADARAMADDFWLLHGPDVNLRREAARFADFVRAEVARGRIDSPYLLEVLDFDLARYDIATGSPGRARAEVDAAAANWPNGPLALHPLVAVARFGHDPEMLLDALRAKLPLPFPEIPEGEYFLLLDSRAGSFTTGTLEAKWVDLIRAATDGRPASEAEGVDELIADGMLV
ncbi:MAG TPA: hypothetical protein VE913_20520, partial [Longimicrobium sp.]|nr:hypothetical protein [Longimicrobium sp.]